MRKVNFLSTDKQVVDLQLSTFPPSSYHTRIPRHDCEMLSQNHNTLLIEARGFQLCISKQVCYFLICTIITYTKR